MLSRNEVNNLEELRFQSLSTSGCDCPPPKYFPELGRLAKYDRILLFVYSFDIAMDLINGIVRGWLGGYPSHRDKLHLQYRGHAGKRGPPQFVRTNPTVLVQNSND